MTPHAGLRLIDWGVLALYIVAILWIGWRESQKGKGQTTKDYFLGGRRFSSFTIGISMFVTLFYGVLTLETGEFVYCNGGHSPPYLVGADGQVRELELTEG